MDEPIECVRCRVPLRDLGVEDFRVGGAAGIGGMLLGGLNQLTEGKLPLDMRQCPKCGEVSLFLNR